MTPAFGSALGNLHTSGPHADPITGLMWGLIALSLLVVAIIAVLLLLGVARGRSPRAAAEANALAVDRDTGGLSWIYVGMGLTMVGLVAALAWTVQVLAQTNSPAVKPALVIQVAGHQWWWSAVYSPDDPARTFVTANEIHIPVGQPVEVRLASADVIHSFWVPALAGKTDTIPGRTNVTWLQADHAGVFRGQCTEYCGAQHAHMGFLVFADPPAQFEAWRANQLNPAAPNPAMADGQGLFVQRCGVCHTVRGEGADGVVGPDLTHLMSRKTIAAATLPNSPMSLSGWVANPQAIKPGARMPPTYLSGPDLVKLRQYLETLT